MPSHQTERITVTWNQVAAFRLARHHLLERLPAEALVMVAGDMTGAQAQLLSAAQVSLWSRLRDLHIAQIDRAMSERTLVKAACMRQTLFLVPSEHLPVFVRGSARRAEREIRWARGKGVPERVIQAAIDAALSVLDQPLTRPEIAVRTSRALGLQVQTYHGGGWGNRRDLAAVPVGELNYPVVDLLHLVATRGVVCYGPNAGNEPTFVRADAWIPGWQDVSTEEAEDRLLSMYLRAYGPATAADFALWCGINLTEARQIWKRQEQDHVSVNVAGWTADLLREDLESLVRAEFPKKQVRLLPYFDSFLLGHKKRDHLVDMDHRGMVYRPQGWIAPTVLVDGRVAAVWEQRRAGSRLIVQVTPFSALSRPVLNQIRVEAQDLGHFLGVPDVDILVT